MSTTGILLMIVLSLLVGGAIGAVVWGINSKYFS